eukprot:4533807-Karenia_brevis.AAC.1
MMMRSERFEWIRWGSKGSQPGNLCKSYAPCWEDLKNLHLKQVAPEYTPRPSFLSFIITIARLNRTLR